MSPAVDECPIGMANVPMQEDRTEAWDYVRSGGEVFKSESDGCWYVTTAEAVRYITRNPKVFSSSKNGIDVSSAPPGVPYIPGAIDPPDHSRYRKVIDLEFAPRVMNRMEDELRARVNLLIDAFIDQGSCELMADLASIFPTEVFCLMFGLPLEDREKCTAWAHTTMTAGPAPEEDKQAARQAGRDLAEYVRGFVETRRSTPGQDDIISHILALGWSDEEIIGLSFNVIQAGLDTVSSAIGLLMYYLVKHPDLRREMITDPAKVVPGIEEVIRLEAVAPFLPRYTMEDVEVCGTKIPAGEWVILGYGVANRDPEAFGCPNAVDLEQGRAGDHFSFGSGIHRCLGSHLARRELKVVFEEFHKRIPEYELAPGAHPAVRWPSLVPALDQLPLVFPPGGTA